MISTRVKIPNRLKIRLSKYEMELAKREFVSKLGDEALLNVMEYGEGARKLGDFEYDEGEAWGGSPYWQGPITVEGHRRGYLSDSHSKKHISPEQTNIVSSADFVEGVLKGYSTNWEGVTFGANNYPKRAVDKIRSEGRIQTIWREVTEGKII